MKSQVPLLVLAKGMATFVPGVVRLACGRSGGTDSSRYCYAVWLRHLVKAAEAGRTSFSSVAELGPGDSLGIGLAAVLTGVDRYYAFDAKAHARTETNLSTFEELIDLFGRREPIPGPDEFPAITPPLSDYDFPRWLEERVETALQSKRLESIRAALRGEPSPITLEYIAPWWETNVVRDGTIDLVFSQAVLEHVDQLSMTYRALHRWLRPGGLMSHAIDFKSHGLTRDWYGHWTVGNTRWRLIRGNRPYLINRAPASQHLALMRAAGFEVLHVDRRQASAAPRALLAEPFQKLEEEDLQTPDLFVQAVRR